MNTYDNVKRKVAGILFNHFNNIIFLDDKFDIYGDNPVNENDNSYYEKEMTNYEETMNNIDPISMFSQLDYKKTEEETAATSQATAFSEQEEIIEPTLEERVLLLLNYCSQNHLNLFPYVYNNLFVKKSFIGFVKKFSLLILDWELDEGNIDLVTEIIDEFSNSDKLQYVIIYTHSLSIDRIADTIKEYFKEQGKKLEIIDDGELLYKKKHTFITVMEKKKIQIKEAILKFSETLIDKYGSLFVGFYDIVNQAREKTGEILTDFMYPFEVLLSVQIKSNDNSDIFFNKKLTEIINSKIMERITINENIGKCINEKILYSAKNEKNVDQRISEITDLINCTDYKKQFKELYDKLKDKDIWKPVVTYMANNSNKFLFFNTNKENTDLHRFLQTKGINLNNNQKEALGMLILLAVFENITDEKSICKMIELIKLIKYNKNEDFGTLVDLTAQKKDEPDFDLYIMNKYFCGDILINNEKKDEFLLCINPPCDLFRPYKSDYCLKYLKGKKIEPIKFKQKLNNKQKLSVHYSIIPVEEKPTVVIWNFNNEMIFNLKCASDLDKLRKYSRLYRMKEDYIKQIISEYSSYWMRMGVDEIFIKDKNNRIGEGFLSILK